ncbi:MAG: tripartite tricarboxylate transporter substrate binding protein [Reyranella sp.]|uniref:Bug family tripartite tricarboxylate transporter substrate binding protein n=1 Tax=Reyranella sp. TaxID=1929291 RepID=UPI001AC09EE0|nr:tripartite tricarboxylate transporter substrate binding protein [Reyranella sp.]MBN9087736.1 tripartite tricarboxylate transporter substrate binding protein [Reyranella sp.]
MTRFNRRRLAGLLGLIVSGLLPAHGASAQDYPGKPVTIVVPFTAGGATDLSARVIAQLLSKELGQPFVVMNRAGASGMIGMASVATAAPDGYTLGWGGNSPMSVAPHLMRNPPYDPLKAFAPIGLAAISSWVMVVRPGLPASSVAELIALAKAQPGRLTFASAGTGSATHLMVEVFKAAAGIDMLHVPYKGEIDGMNAIAADQVDMMMGATSTSSSLMRSGKVKGLAVTTPTRDPAVPETPTVKEAGVPELTFEIFFGLLAPAGTPRSIVDRLSAALVRAVDDPSYREAMDKAGIRPTGSTPEAFASLLERHNRQWLAIIERNNITSN